MYRHAGCSAGQCAMPNVNGGDAGGLGLRGRCELCGDQHGRFSVHPVRIGWNAHLNPTVGHRLLGPWYIRIFRQHERCEQLHHVFRRRGDGGVIIECVILLGHQRLQRNLSGIQALRIGLSGVTAITASEAVVMLTTLADTVVIDPTRVGMHELFGNDVSIYPNPSHGIFHVDGPANGLSLEVMDATGRVISTFGKGNATRTIDLSSHPAGIYLVRMWNASALAVKRIELLGH